MTRATTRLCLAEAGQTLLTKPMLTNTIQSLIDAARDPSTTDAELNAAAQTFFEVVSKVSREEAGGAIRTLSEHFDLDDLSRAGFLALVCGALVERGCD